MLPTRQAQPYRQGAPTREPGLALQAMLRGAAQHMPNPVHPANDQSALAGLLREYAKKPVATADVRGNFATPPGTDLHSLLMQQLLRRSGGPYPMVPRSPRY